MRNWTASHFRPGHPESPVTEEFAGLRPRGPRPWVLDGFCGLAGNWTCTGSHVTDLVGELVDQNAVAESRLADVGTGTAVHGQTVAAFPDDFDGAVRRAGLLGQQGGEADGVGSADDDAGAESGAGELRGLLIRDESALLERDDVICGARGLFGLRRGEQDRAPWAACARSMPYSQ